MWIGFAITAAALILFSVVSTDLYYQSSLSRAETLLKAYIAAFDESREKEELTSEYALELAERLAEARVRVTFLDGDGSVLADSSDSSEESRGDRTEVVEALLNGEGSDVRNSATTGESLVYYCKNYPEKGYLVRLALPTESMWGIYVTSLPAVAVFLVVDAFLFLFVTYFAAGYILRPVEQLAREAAMRKHVKTSSPELRPIADLLNRMNDDVAARVREIDEEKNLVLKAQQSKDEFVANITHEMNTPLTSIKGFAELLASGGLKGESAEKAAHTILAQSERLTNLVSCIIYYNEIDSEDLPVYEVNAGKIVRDILETLSPAFEEKKLVLLSDVSDGVILLSRSERLTEIFGNLIRNAIRYNREGGSVSVLLSEKEFIVSDTGIGIAEENLERIFDRFFTVDRSHGGKNGGFGLGLSVVKKLCEKEGWLLSVKSELGKGTSFRVEFSGADGQ